LILIDDGSPDSSGEICDMYAQKDNRIKVIHQKNRGVSAARNAGLDIAMGEYIIFIDSDDYIEKDYIYHFFAEGNEADLIISGFIIENEDAEVLKKDILDENECFINENNRGSLGLWFEEGKFSFVCKSAIRREVFEIKSLRFNEKICLGEDTLMMVNLLSYVHHIKFIEYAGYHYVRYSHETLSTQGLSKENLAILEELNDKIYDSLKPMFGWKAMHYVARRIGKFYKYVLREIIAQNEIDKQLIKFIFHEYWFRQSLNYVDNIYSDDDIKFRLVLKTKSPCLFIWLIKISRWKNFPEKHT
jgi:glycosyltransferase involved in cell wall biosynthesis